MSSRSCIHLVYESESKPKKTATSRVHRSSGVGLTGFVGWRTSYNMQTGQTTDNPPANVAVIYVFPDHNAAPRDIHSELRAIIWLSGNLA